MKRFLLSFFITLLSVGLLYPQSPDMFNYQAVARDGQGNVIANQSIGIKVSILQGSANGTAVYEEEHTASTTDQGVLNLMIGDGSVLSGTFADINWKSGTYFLEIGMDASGGTSYTTMGTTQLVSVPYAKYADSSGTSFSGNYNDLSNTPVFTDWDQNVSDDFSGDYGDLSNKLWMNRNDTTYTNDVVGIGTDNLAANLTVQGNGGTREVSVRDNYAFVDLNATSGNSGYWLSSNGDVKGSLWYNVSNDLLILQRSDNIQDDISIDQNRNVGINTWDPQERLDVNGTINIRDTTVNPIPGRVYANSMPLAYGQIAESGTINSPSYGINSVTRTSTGVYEVTFNNNFVNYATFSITAFDASGPEIATYNPSTNSNTVTVHIWNSSGTHVNSAFSIVLYGFSPDVVKMKEFEENNSQTQQGSIINDEN